MMFMIRSLLFLHFNEPVINHGVYAVMRNALAEVKFPRFPKVPSAG